jgi:uncharacterized membrane protein YfcA
VTALLLLLIAVLVTSTISGVFGMAGGLLLMGALTLALEVPAAMVTHGVVQLTSNGWRGVLHRRHVRWPILALYAVGSAAASAVLTLLVYSPSRAWVCLLLGLVPAIAWLPRSWFRLDAARPLDAVACGLIVTGLNVLAGVSGPLLDVFFVRTSLTRHQIVATKAATQVLAHAAKILFYGAPLLGSRDTQGVPPTWFFAVAIPLAMTGAVLGGRILARLSDQSFLKYTRIIVTVIGAGYLVLGAREFLAR